MLLLTVRLDASWHMSWQPSFYSFCLWSVDATRTMDTTRTCDEICVIRFWVCWGLEALYYLPKKTLVNCKGIKSPLNPCPGCSTTPLSADPSKSFHRFGASPGPKNIHLVNVTRLTSQPLEAKLASCQTPCRTWATRVPWQPASSQRTAPAVAENGLNQHGKPSSPPAESLPVRFQPLPPAPSKWQNAVGFASWFSSMIKLLCWVMTGRCPEKQHQLHTSRHILQEMDLTFCKLFQDVSTVSIHKWLGWRNSFSRGAWPPSWNGSRYSPRRFHADGLWSADGATSWQPVC